MSSKQKPRFADRNACILEIARRIYRNVAANDEACTKALQSSKRLREFDKHSTELCTGTVIQSVHNIFSTLLSAKEAVSGLHCDDIETTQGIGDANQLISNSIAAAVESSKRELLRKTKRMMQKHRSQIVVVEDSSDEDVKIVNISTKATEWCENRKETPDTTRPAFANVSIGSQTFFLTPDINPVHNVETQTIPTSRNGPNGNGDNQINSTKEMSIVLSKGPLDNMTLNLTSGSVTRIFSETNADFPKTPNSKMTDIVASSETSKCEFEERRLQSWISSARSTNESLGQKIQEEEYQPDLFGDGLLIIKKTMPVRIYKGRPRKKKRGRKKTVNNLQASDTKTRTGADKENAKKAKKRKPRSRESAVVYANVEGSRYGRPIRKPERYGCYVDHKTSADCEKYMV